jgi:hypothetical protein
MPAMPVFRGCYLAVEVCSRQRVLTAVDWIAFKGEISRLTVEKDALHIYAAVLIQVAAAWLLNKPLSSRLPWLVVLLAELVNEASDLFFDPTETEIQEWQLAGASHDLLNTMIMPTALLMLVRHKPSLFRSDP